MAKELNKEDVYNNFGQGINCCMQVFGAVAEDIGLSEAEARRIGAGFGSGMFLASTCGCVTGGLMAIGYKYGNWEPGQTEQRELFNRKKAAFLEAFRARFGNTQCVSLLDDLDPGVPEQRALIVQKGLMREFCGSAVCATVEILKGIL